MPSVLKIQNNVRDGVVEFLSYLLKSKKVNGIFTLTKMNADGAVSYSMITHPDELEKIDPLCPLMPVNAGRVLSDFSLQGAPKGPVAAVLHPCEMRAFVELLKRAQGSRENMLLISMTCGGTFPIASSVKTSSNGGRPDYWKSVGAAEAVQGLKPSCSICEHFTPQHADITISLVGEKDLEKECVLILNSAQGESFADGAPGSVTSGELKMEAYSKLQNVRKEQKSKIYQPLDPDGNGLKSMVKTFASCLSCHGCSKVCPICTCNFCDFDSKTHESSPSNYTADLAVKGGTRVPSGTLLFHIGRMAHMAVSCVGCGMCSDVCPVNIPVSVLFNRVGESLQKEFDYVPGRDIEEPVPSGSFKEEEFKNVGE